MTSTQQLRATGTRRILRGTCCPSCGESIPADAQWCGSCRFTGADSMKIFAGPPPPLMPLLDVADLWKESDVKKIEAAREKLRRRFPQFNFHVCTAVLPEDKPLPLFGFWLLNACPFYVNETAEDRSWTVLLLLNANNGQAAVVPGYAAEHWISDEDWMKILALMAKPWKAGKTAEAVVRFFEGSATFLDHAWKIRGLRRSKKSRS